MRPGILVLTQAYPPALEALEREFHVHKLWLARDRAAFLTSVADRIRGMVTTGLVGFDSDLVSALPCLEIVACFSVAHGTLALEAARARGIVVTNTPDSSADSVVDLAMGLIVAILRGIGEGDRFVRAGKWIYGVPPLGTKIGGGALGIIGLGNIGKVLAKRADAFGMRVTYFGPRRKHDVPYPYFDDLKTMARDCDCLVVACPARPETRHLVDAKMPRALGADGTLINVARGSIVDEEVMVAALHNKSIAGAGLDVFGDEPRVTEALLALDNVVLTPHIGTSTREIRAERCELLLANLRAHFFGKPVLTPVR